MRRNGWRGPAVRVAGIPLIAKSAMSGAPAPDKFSTGLERIPQGELKRPRAAGAEKLPRRVESPIESCRINLIVESRVVPVGCVPDVGHIGQVEYFGDH